MEFCAIRTGVHLSSSPSCSAAAPEEVIGSSEPLCLCAADEPVGALEGQRPKPALELYQDIRTYQE